MLKPKNQTVIRKIIIAIFLAINLGIFRFFPTKLPSLMRVTTFLVPATFAFALESGVSAGELAIAIIIFVSEIICLPSLFTGKSIYKIVCNIIFHIICIADIYFCIKAILNQYDIIFNIFEIIIDLLFMGLILYDLLKVYNVKFSKKKKLCKPKSEQNEEQGDDFLH